MLTRSTGPWWLVLRSALLFGVIAALLAGTALQQAGPLAQAQRAEATAAAARIQLVADAAAAAERCVELGQISASAINSSFGRGDAAALGAQYSSADADPSTEGTVQYVTAVESVYITAIEDGDCATHGRNLGGMSPWLGGAIGIGCGLTVRIGLLSLLLWSGVGLTIARPASEAVGGFVAGALSQYLIAGEFSARTLAAGMFGALAGALGGAASRAVIEKMTRLPTQAAGAVRALGGEGVAMNAAGAFAADALEAAQPEWDAIIAEFLANNP